MMTFKQTRWQRSAIVFIALLVCFSAGVTAIPTVTHAQGLNAVVGASGVANDAGSTSCSSGWNLSNLNPICWMRGIFAGLGSLFMYIGITVLTWMSMLFEFALKATIVDFRGLIFNNIEQGVNTAWSAFRDIANILIIGIFTFISIGTILGLQTLNEKKMVAKVLIIAILINFSLLFTKMMIDVSNFTALQLYNGALKQADEAAAPSATANTGAGAATITGNGVAGSFLRFLGVGGIADSYNALRGIQENNDNALLGLVYGILSFVFLIATALVFLYGTYLLASRALIFIFLMVTASLAFASYLVPAWEKSSYGWDVWWKSLIGSAVLAPALMLFLWITLNVSNSLSKALCSGGHNCGTLGALMTSQTPGANIAALFNFVMVLGMLFISFKLSSKNAGTVTGFNLAGALALSPLIQGSRFLVGGAGRLGIGMPAYFAAKRLGKDAKRENNEAAAMDRAADRHEALGNIPLAEQTRKAAAEKRRLAASKLKSMEQAGKLADSRFNIMDTKTAQNVAKTVGITGFAAGQSGRTTLEKSYADQVKGRTEKAEKIAAKIAPSAEDNEKVKEIEKERIRRERRKEGEDRKKAKEIAEAALKDAADEADGKMNPAGERPLKEQLTTAEKVAKATKDQLTTVGNEFRTAFKAAANDGTLYSPENVAVQEDIRDSLKKMATENPALANDPKFVAQQKAAQDIIDQAETRASNLSADERNQYSEAKDAAKRELDAAAAEVAGGKATAAAKHDPVIQGLKAQLSTITDSKQRKVIEDQLASSEEQRRSDMRHQEDRIEQARIQVQSKIPTLDPAVVERARKYDEVFGRSRDARSNAEQLVARIGNIENDPNLKRVQNDFATAEKKYGETLERKWQTDTERLANSAANEGTKGLATSAQGVVKEFAAIQGDILTRTLGKVTLVNKAVQDEIPDLFKKKVKTAGLRDVLADIQTGSGAGGGAPAAPAAPAS